MNFPASFEWRPRNICNFSELNKFRAVACSLDDINKITQQQFSLLPLEGTPIGLIIRFEACVVGNNTQDPDIKECLSANLSSSKTSENCRTCLVEVFSCIISKCSRPCTNQVNQSNHNECEKCTKVEGCSLNKCTSPNYFDQKEELAGILTKIGIEYRI